MKSEKAAECRSYAHVYLCLFVDVAGEAAEDKYPRRPNLFPELPSDIWYPFRLRSAATRGAPAYGRTVAASWALIADVCSLVALLLVLACACALLGMLWQ